jgi:hypothetical protein
MCNNSSQTGQSALVRLSLQKCWHVGDNCCCVECRPLLVALVVYALSTADLGITMSKRSSDLLARDWQSPYTAASVENSTMLKLCPVRPIQHCAAMSCCASPDLAALGHMHAMTTCRRLSDPCSHEVLHWTSISRAFIDPLGANTCTWPDIIGQMERKQRAHRTQRSTQASTQRHRCLHMMQLTTYPGRT